MLFGVGVVFMLFVFSTHINGIFISNLNDACLRCLCQAATGCNTTQLCTKGYCGPFYISRIYWVDADRPVIPEDDPEREGAYRDCALQYACAKRIVEKYMAKYGRDCNGDRVTGCDDYALIHYNGGFSCEGSLEGTGYNDRYLQCRKAQSAAEKRT